MTSSLGAIEASGVTSFFREAVSLWAYPALLTMHTLGLGVLVGASAVVDLRLLGAAPRIPLEAFRHLFPIMWAGFWINALSGVALFAADAKGTTRVFVSKLVVMVIAVVVLMSIRRMVYGHGAAANTATVTVRALAVASLVLWIAAIATRRYIAGV
jgi:hypothetical protein